MIIRLTKNVLLYLGPHTTGEAGISIQRIYSWPKTSVLWGFLKTTDQPNTYHRPPTNRATDHRPNAPTTDQPITDQ